MNRCLSSMRLLIFDAYHVVEHGRPRDSAPSISNWYSIAAGRIGQRRGVDVKYAFSALFQGFNAWWVSLHSAVDPAETSEDEGNAILHEIHSSAGETISSRCRIP